MFEMVSRTVCGAKLLTNRRVNLGFVLISNMAKPTILVSAFVLLLSHSVYAQSSPAKLCAVERYDVKG